MEHERRDIDPETLSRRRPRDEFEITVDDRRLRFRTQPGVFSQDGPDEGSMLLLHSVLPHVRPHQTVLDLGSGVGLLGLALAHRLTRGEVWLTDSDVRAVRLTRENIALNSIENAHSVLGDVALDLPKVRFDLVVSNPPTHSGKDVLALFVSESFDVLRPGGALYVVINRLLSVRAMMADTFGSVEQVARHKGFLILRSEKLRRGHESDKP